MNLSPADVPVDQSNESLPGTPAWRCFPAMVIFFVLAGFMVGGAAMSDASTNVSDIITIISVVAFVGAMVALALGMVGDAYRSHP